MPFGLTNAPKSFLRAMTDILRGLKNIDVFTDDIVIHSRSLDEHIDHLGSVFGRLKKRGVSINFEKCQFAKH